MRAGLIVLVIIVVAAVVAALNSLFIINPTQQALVLQFGQVKNTIREPGLNLKIPFVQDVLILDKRILDLNVPAQEIIAADQKRLVVDAFMRYRIVNPVEFYQTVNNVNEGAQRLNTFVQASLRAVLADATFTDIVRDNRPELMQRIKADVAARAKSIGVDIIDVRLRRADLPEANSAAIYRRMQTEREQEAREIRAQGEEAARRIEAAADRTATVLRAEARSQSEQIRGEGDARKNAIFAAAYTLDPAFFDFYRSMQAYEQGLRNNGTRLVSPDADFFRYFASPTGIPRGALGSGSGAPAGEGPADEARNASPVLEIEPSNVDPAEVRRRIEEMAGELADAEPVSGTAVVPRGDGGVEIRLDEETERNLEANRPAETSTEAAVEGAEPAPSDAANDAAGGAIPQEDIPAMDDPDETGGGSADAPATGGANAAEEADAASSGETATDANVTIIDGDGDGADDTTDETATQQ